MFTSYLLPDPKEKIVDVVRWRVSFVRSGREDEPALKLELVLRCRVCKMETAASSYRTMLPAMVENGDPLDDPRFPRSWFHLKVDYLSNQRECTDCGTVSVIPKPQRMPLIEQADAEVDRDWLLSSEGRLNLKTKVLPKTDHYTHRVVYDTSSGGRPSVEREWHYFQWSKEPV